MQEKIPWTYCPLCGERGLFRAKRGNEIWAYCGNGANRLEDAHTAFVYEVLETAKIGKPKEITGEGKED